MLAVSKVSYTDDDDMVGVLTFLRPITVFDEQQMGP
jgi:hypothetical protein